MVAKDKFWNPRRIAFLGLVATMVTFFQFSSGLASIPQIIDFILGKKTGNSTQIYIYPAPVLPESHSSGNNVLVDSIARLNQKLYSDSVTFSDSLKIAFSRHDSVRADSPCIGCSKQIEIDRERISSINELLHRHHIDTVARNVNSDYGRITFIAGQSNEQWAIHLYNESRNFSQTVNTSPSSVANINLVHLDLPEGTYYYTSELAQTRGDIKVAQHPNPSTFNITRGGWLKRELNLVYRGQSEKSLERIAFPN